MNTDILQETAKVLRAAGRAAPGLVATQIEAAAKLVDLDLDMALVRSRRALDLILRHTCTVADVEMGTKPLEQVLSDLQKRGAMPPLIDKHCRTLKNLGNLGAHGSEDPSLSPNGRAPGEAELVMCASALDVVARWYVESIVPSLLLKATFKILHGRELSKEHVLQTIDVDKRCYPAHYQPEVSRVLGWHEHNPDIYTGIVDTSTCRLVGYMNAMPLEDEMFEAILAGDVVDVVMPLEAIKRYDLPDLYRLYIASVALDPDYKETSAIRTLLMACLNKLLILSRQEIFVSELLADAVSPGGEHMCKMIGMTKLHPSKHDSMLYRSYLLPPSFPMKSTTVLELTKKYRAKHDELQALVSQ